MDVKYLEFNMKIPTKTFTSVLFLDPWLPFTNIQVPCLNSGWLTESYSSLKHTVYTAKTQSLKMYN
jgi:hypothetical protein